MCASSAGDNEHSLCCQDCFVFVFVFVCTSSAGDNEHSLSCQDCITASQFKLPAPIPATFLSCSEPLHFPSPPVSSSCISCFVKRHLLNVTIIVIRASQFKLPAPLPVTLNVSCSEPLHFSSHPCLSFFVSRFLDSNLP